jgi:hypothetical protein
MEERAMSDAERERATRVRLHDHFAKTGYSLPVARRNAPPKVLWAREGCKDRLARLYFTPDGWLLITDGFRDSLEGWVGRFDTETTAEDVRSGRIRKDGELHDAVFTNLRKVEGLQKTLPIDLDEWPKATVELGCKHANADVSIRQLAADARDSVTTRRVLRRYLPLSR